MSIEGRNDYSLPDSKFHIRIYYFLRTSDIEQYFRPNEIYHQTLPGANILKKRCLKIPFDNSSNNSLEFKLLRLKVFEKESL
jgi:hypothetical protein